MNKKIILSVSIVAIVAAAVIGATTAFFSDTEQSTGNTFTAGTLDLKVDSKCHYNGMICIDGYWAQEFHGIPSRYPELIAKPCSCTWIEKNLQTGDLFFNFNDVKPGDDGEDTISLHVDTNDAYICAQISNLKNEENGCTSPEKKAEQACADDPDHLEGELLNNLLFTVWKDTGDDGGGVCDNIHQKGEQILVDDQPATNGYWPIADSTTGGALTGNTTFCLGVSWIIPSETGNGIQTDKLTADISFDAIQARNIPQFLCTAQGGCAPQEEMCNGKDDDCDGTIDEGWELGGACEVGLGACHATGTYVCSPASPLAESICSAVAGTPTTEQCAGGIDDDCDGTIDCGDPDCANDQVCAPETDTVTMRLINKNGGTGYGDLIYNPSGPTFDFTFSGHELVSGRQYSLIYYADGWSGNHPGAFLGKGYADVSGNLNLSGNLELGMNLPTLPDANFANGAKVWLVTSAHYDEGTKGMKDWDASQYLWETDWVHYQDTDLAHTETITLTDLGASPQYGYDHNYSGANVSFQYTTPATNQLSGTITATGLKPYATYQLKFGGKPTCQYGAAGDDAGNEQIGYMGRWWDNTTNSNTNDAGYVANHLTHCITGYLVWGYITADASGNATKVVTTDSSYHVLWCSGGTCGQSNNSQLAFLDPAHPLLNLCSAGNVNGQIERGTCGGLTFDSGTYKLDMSLTEESFHQGPGTWTTVMNGGIEFKIN